MSGFPSRPVNSIQGNVNQLIARKDVLGYLGANQANSWWVDPTNGSSQADGKTPLTAVTTITQVLALMAANAGNYANQYIFCMPGRYDESPTISRTLSKITLVGVGGRGAVYIDPTTEDADGLTVHADDVTLINIGCAAEDITAGNVALTVSGARFRAFGCKIEGGAVQVQLGPGTVAQQAANTHGTGADSAFYDCEICWGTTGVVLTASDYGAVTQALFESCRFHNLTDASFEETGGTVSIRYRNLWIKNCHFDDLEDGTAPTAWVLLNDDNGNSGLVSGCVFPSAINSGKNLVSTACHWIANYQTGGITTAQPS